MGILFDAPPHKQECMDGNMDGISDYDQVGTLSNVM